ncbi:MAG: flagellar basal body rod protein FlgC [Deltaproteobacteria bacterium]|nr:flagellar basal body rod protein FlgC [Deltaproteobacteria bacterium]MBF0524541.1 flagellar basal body rod protein FlgC [Deltaproteobacteria bacterium]
MDFLSSLSISSSGLTAQRVRMDLISSNLANVNSTQTEAGGPYRRKEPVFQSVPVDESFRSLYDKQLNLPDKINRVQVVDIVENPKDFRMQYNPNHPQADKDGYVAMPNVNVVEEMANMIEANRSFEANVAVISTTKSMAMKALSISQ